MLKFGELLYRGVNKCNNYLEKKRLFTTRYLFENRQNHSENLLIIVAGFQPYYWDEVFARVEACKKSFSESIDICVCTPEGLKDSKADLQARCEELGWSYLFIEEDLLAQVQNVAINLHPSARYIFKIDEDILLSNDYFDRLKKAFKCTEGKTPYPTGFMGPIININAYGAYAFMNTMGIYQDYVKQFGEYEVYGEIGGDKNKIHLSSEVAEFIWKNSIPFDEVAEKIYNLNKGKYSISPVRFSIGAILFSRYYWERLGYFRVGKLGTMGLEEEQVCGFCMTHFFPIFVAEDVFVGHLGFYSQKEACRNFFKANYEYIKI